MYDAIFMLASMIKPQRQQFFSVDQRLQHTINCSKSIRAKIPNSYLILFETSDISQEMISELKKHFDVVQQPTGIEKYVNHPNIGIGEFKTLQLISEYILEKWGDNIPAKMIFKITSRYQLSNDFDIKNYDVDKFNFLPEICMGMNVYCTQLFGFPVKYLRHYLQTIQLGMFLVNDDAHPVEEIMYRLLHGDRVHEMKKLGLLGQLSYNGTVIKK
jgi:hypothetical protein